ncbi:serine hydrolase [Blautia glucerasea]|uniref:serine hydrolase n=1 Tax=Blautia glucerasea TaxID=536633 RepID=UPI001D07135A|nr:class A beta-lactamase-related serine hydrolase [Blautia glucerasea]
MKENYKHRAGIYRGILFLMLAMFAVASVSSAATKVQVQAASKKNTNSNQKTSRKIIKLMDKSGNYLIYTGYNWWLKDKNGKKLTGMRCIRVPAGQKLRSGYYMFDGRGCLCKRRRFYRVNTVIGSKRFKGTYYFGGDYGSLYRRAGWKTINGYTYLLGFEGKRYENRWKYGYYFNANGKIVKNRKISEGVYVDCDGRRCTEAEMEISSLKKKLRTMLNSYYGSWSVYVKDLKTGGVVNLNESAMYSASIIKPFVMASTFDQIQKGNLSYSSTIKGLLREMITVSDNEAYNQLVKYNSTSRSFLSGASVVNRYLEKNKYTKTGCHHTLHPASSASVGDGRSNITSAKDCGILLEHIYNGTCVSSRSSKEMRNLLLAQTRRWKIPSGIPSGVRVANKTGETSSVEHDMAIVYGKKKDYIICVFSNTGSEDYALPRIREISRTVYNYLN